MCVFVQRECNKLISLAAGERAMRVRIAAGAAVSSLPQTGNPRRPNLSAQRAESKTAWIRFAAQPPLVYAYCPRIT